LNVNHVLAFIPQTLRRNKNIDEKYRDISKFINETTKYYLYGDLSVSDAMDCHHISHCERISHHSNVTRINKDCQVLGESHPDTLRTMNNLAHTFENQNKHVEAETLYKQCLDKRKVVLGHNHPSTLNTMNNLARTTSKIQSL
jgi:hypothetical protein